MSVLLGLDEFDRAAGTLTTPWTIRTGDTWKLTGNQVYASDTTPFAPSYYTPPGVERLAILMDPYPLLTANTAGAKIMSVQVTITTPPVFSTTYTEEQGIVFLSAGANSLPHFEVVWSRTTGGTNTIKLYSRASAGRTLWATLASLSATTVSTVYSLRIEHTILSASNSTLFAYWDAAPTAGISISSGFMTTVGFSGNPQTNSHYVGLYGLSAGLQSTSAGPVFSPINPAYFDDFTVRDTGIESTPIYAEPTLTADPTLATIAVQAENDSTGDTFVLRPSYAIQVDQQIESNEHRFDGGYAQSVARASGRRRRWSLWWDALSSAQRSTFITHIATVSGKKKHFAWQDPDTGQGVVVRFTADPVISQVAPSVWSASATVEETGG